MYLNKSLHQVVEVHGLNHDNVNDICQNTKLMNLCWNVYLNTTLTLNHCMFLVQCKTNLTMYLLLKKCIYIYINICLHIWTQLENTDHDSTYCISASLVLKPQLAAYLLIAQIYRTTSSYFTNHPLFTRYSGIPILL